MGQDQEGGPGRRAGRAGQEVSLGKAHHPRRCLHLRAGVEPGDLEGEAPRGGRDRPAHVARAEQQDRPALDPQPFHRHRARPQGRAGVRGRGGEAFADLPLHAVGEEAGDERQPLPRVVQPVQRARVQVLHQEPDPTPAALRQERAERVVLHGPGARRAGERPARLVDGPVLQCAAPDGAHDVVPRDDHARPRAPGR